MDRPAADERDEMIAGLLQPQRAFDQDPMVTGELDRAGVPEEVRGVKEVDVQGVALDPLAAVQQPAQGPDRRVDLDAGRVLERVDGAHLVGDRADPADARDDVEDLVGRPAADQPLEVARRLEDPEMRLDDLAVLDDQPERALALDAGEALRPRSAGSSAGAGWSSSSGASVSLATAAGFAPGGPPWASTTERKGSAQDREPGEPGARRRVREARRRRR